MSPEEFLHAALHQALQLCDKATDPAVPDEEASKAAWMIAARAGVAYFADQLIKIGAADTVREWITMCEAGAPVAFYVAARTEELGIEL